jgi:hypothetical protein
MKTKRKKQNSKNGKSYPALYLAVALSAILLLEGFLLGAATPGAWQQGLQVLDISSHVDVAMSDMVVVVEPFFQMYSDVNTFYQMAATELIAMLDFGEQDYFAFFRGVGEFYELASIEMENMLDLSDQFVGMGQVAGASISR